MSSSNHHNSAGGASRKSKGRQKVSMVKMQKQSNLQVTFSKRRGGLFKKASELCTLCGAEAAIVVFSPAEKPYCFGHPNLKTLLDRVVSDPSPTVDPGSQLVMEAHRNSTIRQLNVELTQVEGLLKAEKKRAQEIPMCPSLDGLSYAELCTLKDSVLGFKNKLDAKVQQHVMLGFSSNALSSSSSSSHHHQTDNLSSFPTSDSATKLTLGLGWNGFSNAGLFASNEQVISSDINYGVFNLVGGSNSSFPSMFPDHSRASFGHDHPAPGFF